MGEKGEGIRKYKLVVTVQLWGFKFTIRNVIHDIITMYGARWVLDLSGRSLHSLCKCLTSVL